MSRVKSLRVRTGPGPFGDVVGALSKGEEAWAVGKSSFTSTVDGREGLWYEVESSSGIRGWAFGGYLEFPAEE